MRGYGLAWLALAFAAAVCLMPFAEPVFAALFPELSRPIYSRAGFVTLTASHIAMVAGSSLLATTIGVVVGVLVSQPAGREFLPLAETVAAIGQTFPPVAVLAVAVPLTGFGATPTLLALTLYGVLPVLGNTIAGLAAVPAPPREAADGMGFARFGRLIAVDLPLAAPVILAGIRTSTIINIGTATIGSTVGALTLGSPIIEGLAGSNIAYVIQGAIIVGLLAMLTDAAFGRLEARVRRSVASA